MCRAFVGINLQKDNPEATELMRKYALHYMYNSHKEGNKEGYFFSEYNPKQKPNSLRSMYIVETLDFIEKSKPSNVFHGHARIASRGSVNENNIHGWEMRGFHTSHNGTIMVPNKYKQYDCDSQTFWDAIFTTCWGKTIDEIITNTKKFLEEEVTGGVGVFFATNHKYTIGIAYEKQMTINQINGSALLLNSQNDIHKFDDEVGLWITDPSQKVRDEVKLGPLTLKKSFTPATYKAYCSDIDVQENLFTNFENAIIIIDNFNGEVVKFVEFEPKKHLKVYRTPTMNTGACANAESKRYNENVVFKTSETLPIEQLTKAYFDMKYHLEEAATDLDANDKHKEDSKGIKEAQEEMTQESPDEYDSEYLKAMSNGML